jgi:hypothetical protein
MSGWLIIIVGLLYAAVAIEQVWKGHLGMAIVYGGYAFSNVGLWLITR